jgi:hypothetical protein
MATKKRRSPAARAAGLAKKAGHVGFKAVEAEVAAKGAADPAALAAYIGRKKYGAAGMAALSAAGRAKAKH